ncbi:ComEA family DNA-binding protein [Desulfomarina sp.]
MKLTSVCVAIMLACVFSFSVVPGQVFAKSSAQEVTGKVKTESKTRKKTRKTKAEAKKKTAKKSTKKATKNFPKNVDINRADKELLMQLPGIGPKTAEAILKYRKANGKFKNINNLVEVKGIGEKTLAKLKPFLKKI